MIFNHDGTLIKESKSMNFVLGQVSLKEKSFEMIASTIDMVYNDEEMFSAAECTKKEQF